jgi:hypothetical protein
VDEGTEVRAGGMTTPDRSCVRRRTVLASLVRRQDTQPAGVWGMARGRTGDSFLAEGSTGDVSLAEGMTARIGAGNEPGRFVRGGFVIFFFDLE